MWILLLGLTSGLVASSWAISVDDVKMRSCSYLGVFHIQGNDRYTLAFDEAEQLCEALGTTLASLEQVTAAHGKGFETCRNGWISNGNVTIPRHVPMPHCAGNQIGVITLASPEPKNDAYCYDHTDQSEINCTFEIKHLEEDSELTEATESNESQDSNHTDSLTDLPATDVPVDVHINSTVTDVTTTTDVPEETDATPASSHDEHNVSEEVLDQLTQPPFMTPEPEDQEGGTNGILSVLSTLESTGSGMGETTLTTASEPIIDDTYIHSDFEDTSELPPESTTEEPLNPDMSVRPGGRMGPGMSSSPEEKGSSGSSTDWLVILIVVVAIAAIILVAALVVTRNRWCGRSQTLMITTKSSKEGNGTAASAASPQDQEREQEMVTLMNKEKIQENGNTEEFTVITLEESPEKTEQA